MFLLINMYFLRIRYITSPSVRLHKVFQRVIIDTESKSQHVEINHDTAAP